MRWVDVDVRLVGAGLLAVVVAVVVFVLTAPPERVEVIEAGAALPSGVPLEQLDLKVRTVEDPTGWVAASSIESLNAHVLLAPVAAGAPIPESLVVDPAGRQVDVVGFELEAAASVHGHLEAGDQVDVYSVDPVELVARSVPVLWVEADRGSFGTGGVGLLLAVDEDLAPRLVSASRDGMHLVRRGE